MYSFAFFPHLSFFSFYTSRSLFHFPFFAFCFIFRQQIRNVFGAKSAKAHNNSNNSSNSNVNEVTDQCDVVAADLYVSQLKNFIAKNSNDSFDCRQQQQPKQPKKSKQVAEREHHLHLSTYLPNSSEPKSQYKDLKRKCKRAVYKFMKGLFDERKLQKFKNFNQDEPIYFEVSTKCSMPTKHCRRNRMKQLTTILYVALPIHMGCNFNTWQ